MDTQESVSIITRESLNDWLANNLEWLAIEAFRIFDGDSPLRQLARIERRRSKLERISAGLRGDFPNPLVCAPMVTIRDRIRAVLALMSPGRHRLLLKKIQQVQEPVSQVNTSIRFCIFTSAP
ncbi:hypothetical protein [Deinococcus cellulosilyticus]|uniref:Uncharacterized protein n=1 Tax=Deinococcus cellulosilyticus (strain DSM 18568 / NBRC 106333 / KACC 11606 / 5516J-15) TaxID=1223518 RepID=A0A511N9Z0_DEIC1|nr:hypothetical protein [Deinococcus cellulosilyticus]GEM49620.1 hypothetical protein DC3_52550 [Deinococcus cellulosilyticus NBRC 106333 = KACC 11606]